MFGTVRLAAYAISLVLAWPSAAWAQDASATSDAQRSGDSGIRFLNPAGLPTPAGYSHAVDAPDGRTIYVSGQLPVDKDGKLIGAGDFAAQAEQVFANLKIALAAADASFDDVVKLNMFVTDMEQLKSLRTARDRYINPTNAPASTLVEVKRFVRDGVMVEIDATAVIGGGERK